MSDRIQLRRGTEAQRTSVTFAQGEAAWTTDEQELWVGDGATAGGIRVTPEQVILDPYSGFYAWDSGSGYYTISGSDFTLDRAGTGFIRGFKITWAAAQTVTLGGANTITYIYIDSSGTLQSTTTSSSTIWTDNIPLFEVFTYADGSNRVTVRENHPADYQTTVARWAHQAGGTVFSLDSGAVIEAAATTGHIKITGAGTLLDHGLEDTIPDSGGLGVSWDVAYLNGSTNWARYAQQQALPAYYNNSGTPTALGVAKYGAYRLYASKSDLEGGIQYVAVMDSTEHASLGAAQSAVESGEVQAATAPLTGIEVCQLGYAIVNNSGAVVDTIIEKATLASTSGGITGLGSMAFQDDTAVNIDGGTVDGLTSLSTTGNGLDVNPGSDTDADLITVGVTGAPKIFWDESADVFAGTKGISVGPSQVCLVDGWEPDGTYARFGHKDFNAAAGYGVLQSPTGRLFLGAPSGEEVRVTIAGTTTVTFSATQTVLQAGNQLVVNDTTDSTSSTSSASIKTSGGISCAKSASFGGTIRSAASLASLYDNASGTYSSWSYNGTVNGDIGTANQVVSGSTSDFAITSRAGSLILGSNFVTRVTIDSSGYIIPVLPTSSAGLPSGALWNDTGTVKVA